MLVIKNIFNHEGSDVIEIECFFSMPSRKINPHFYNQICIKSESDGKTTLWFGYPNGKHSSIIEEKEIIDYIQLEMEKHIQKSNELLGKILNLLESIKTK